MLWEIHAGSGNLKKGSGFKILPAYITASFMDRLEKCNRGIDAITDT